MLNPHKLERYRNFIDTYSVLPIGWGKDKKAPCLKAWQLNRHLSLEAICNYRDAIALGVTTEDLWVLDIDGDSAVRWARSKGVLDGEFTWEIHRTTSPTTLRGFGSLPYSKENRFQRIKMDCKSFNLRSEQIQVHF